MAAVLFELNSRTPTIMLGILAGAKEAGIYTVASLITTLIVFYFNFSQRSAWPPSSQASIYRGEIPQLQRIVTRSARFDICYRDRSGPGYCPFSDIGYCFSSGRNLSSPAWP